MEEVEGWEQQSGVCGGWEFRGFRGSVAITVGAKGPHHPSIVYLEISGRTRKGRRPQRERRPLHKSVQEAETGEYLPIDGSTHSDPPSSR